MTDYSQVLAGLLIDGAGRVRRERLLAQVKRGALP